MERAIVGSHETESIQQHFSDTTVNTELTSEDKLQEEMKSDKEMLCILSKEVEILQRQLWMNSNVIARIGKDDKQIHFYIGFPSNVVFEVLLDQLSPLVAKTPSIGSGLS